MYGVGEAQVVSDLFIGNKRLAEATEFLELNKIRVIVSLGSSLVIPENRQDQIEYIQCSILDKSAANMLQVIHDTVPIIDAHRRAGRAVLVHCYAGKSRSAAVVMAYLMSQGIDREEAYRMTRRARFCISPNPGFWAQLELYAKWDCKIDLDSEQYQDFLLHTLPTYHKDMPVPVVPFKDPIRSSKKEILQ
eukprot:Clim_evm51s109 gene=Clim_evmTU51s109